MSYVYAIGDVKGLVKIGKSKKPQKRLRELQVGSPVKLFILSFRKETELFTEKRVHNLVAFTRAHGEWFAVSHKLIDVLFSGDDRIMQLVSLTPRKVDCLVQSLGEQDVLSCLSNASAYSDSEWGLAMMAASNHKKKSRGRPKSGGTNPIREVGRCSDAEWDIVVKAARLDCSPVATWARKAVLRAAKRRLMR